jgi:hypothetical protein
MTQIFALTTGLFFTMWLGAMLTRKRKHERRYYHTEMPSTYIIERED